MTIKPIQTTYKGYRFRSRVEARWAVFFDAMGWEWEYEVEGFEMPDGTRYLPDFVVTIKGYNRGDVSARSYVFEIKRDDSGDYEKAWKLAKFGGREVIVVEGPPAAKVWTLFNAEAEDQWDGWPCYFCSRNRIWFDERFDPENVPDTFMPAVNASRGARFEFGEGR